MAASLERVWENVYDWEHLPYLHDSSFCGIDLEEAGDWGWRARVKLPPAAQPTELTIELRADRVAGVYHTRTLAGPGTGSDIVTRLSVSDRHRTDVAVAFHIAGVPDAAREAIGAGYVRLYTRLWDEDEAMMQQRQAFLDGRAPKPPAPGPRPRLALGSATWLREAGARIVELAGDRFRVVLHEDRLVAHPLVCPHQGASLADATFEAGAVVCPWHGYRFDCESGRGPAGQRCRMAVGARVEVDERGDAHLVVT
ncbi:MAG: Rieske (2Fe-2S) protein [Myxococcota bacterium]